MSSVSASGRRILVTNDDGIHAEGIAVLERVALQLSSDVWVVGPETEQSGASHSLTLNDPLRLRHVDERKFAVRGTPSDCVMMAVRHIMADHPPDLVLSGVNRGSNMAEDVTYSGTIAAAMEGTVLGIPSIALSQVYGIEGRDKIKWACAETHALPVINRLVEQGWPQDVLININFPDREPDNIDGIRVTSQGRRDQSTVDIESRLDVRGNEYYWLGLKRGPSTPNDGTDLHAIYNGYISVCPLHLNLSHDESRKALSAAFED